MSTPSHSKPTGRLKRLFSTAAWLLWGLTKRGYALGLIVLVLWLSWQAVFYLVSSLMLPARPPKQIVDIPTKLNESVLVRHETGHQGGAALINPRSPLSHYHRLGQGFQVDQFNGCTASQCHSPLPHGKNKANRAFLNMHATSIHCGVCHLQTDQQPLPLVWYDLMSGKVRNQAPALLQAYAWLTGSGSRTPPTFSALDQAQIVRLLRTAAKEAYIQTDLTHLAEHLAAVRSTSDEFLRLLKVTREAVRGHFRGEYGAKLALIDPGTRKPFLRHPGIDKAKREFLNQRATLSPEQKKLLLAQIHPQRRNPTLHCAGCHQPEVSLIDLLSLGYPPARIQAISDHLVTRAIDHIAEGKPFYLPGFLEAKE